MKDPNHPVHLPRILAKGQRFYQQNFMNGSPVSKKSLISNEDVIMGIATITLLILTYQRVSFERQFASKPGLGTSLLAPQRPKPLLILFIILNAVVSRRY